MRTLTQSNVTQLITDYKQVKKNLENIQVQMSRTVQAALVEGQVADPAILLNVKGCLQQAEAVLNDYTAGFLRFSRSMAKTQNANKPDEKFLENVRAIRSDAEDILQDFRWTLDHLGQQIVLHNMALGDFSAVMPTAVPQEPEAPAAAKDEDNPIAVSEAQEAPSMVTVEEIPAPTLMTAQEDAGSAGTGKLPEGLLGGEEE